MDTQHGGFGLYYLLGVFAINLLGSTHTEGAEWTGTNIGAVTLEGTSVPAGAGWSVSGGGRDIGGAEDQFFYAWREQPGDFDFSARVANMDATDVWAKAGLMLRETLEPNSAFAAVFTSPSLAGCFMQSRTVPGGLTAQVGSHPVNFPQMWLRLQRQADQITTYAGLDGEHWERLGTLNWASTNVPYFGLAVTSHNTNALCRAEFQELGAARDEGWPDWPDKIEGVGPSSRRTCFALTEIMHHPPPQPGRDMRFIELFNSNPFPEEVGGFRLAGAVSFRIPDGTVIPGGGFLVIAGGPEDIKTVYGITNVIGSFVGDFGESGTVELLDRTGGVLLEAKFGTQWPWPGAADGLGHSLVLARPSYGERNPLAWAASGRRGGSPGQADGTLGSRLTQVLINEVRAGTGVADGFVELYNHGHLPVDLSGAKLLAGDHDFTVTEGTVLPAGGFLSISNPLLALNNATPGTAIALEIPDGGAVIDVLRLTAEAALGSIGRYPDGGMELGAMHTASPGAPNREPNRGPVVINEIMYHPISGDDRDEYVELHNPTAAMVDVSGWEFTDGITFTIPVGQSIPPGGFLVIAKDAARLRSLHPELTAVVGNFQGKLSGKGERLALAKPLPLAPGSRLMVLVDAVSYGTGGSWGKWADGGGSSLERRSPKAASQIAANWADSNTARSAEWTTIETTGVLDNGGDVANSLQVLLLGAGECLVDNVEVIAQNGTSNLVGNATFENGLNGWTLLGNHFRSSLELSEGYESTHSLHLRASGRGDTGANQVRIPLGGSSALQPGKTATIRAKVRWLKGWPEIVLRLHGNYLEATGRLLVPPALGTPGQANSALVSNLGPSIEQVSHYPALPAANDSVHVTARVQDADGLAVVWLHYRRDPAMTFESLPMHDDGLDGDAVAGDSVYTAVLPGQQAGALVAFHITAADKFSGEGSFPENAPSRECLVRFGEPIMASTFGAYRLWLTAATVNTWRSRPVLSNEELDGTFIYGNRRVVYNAGARYSGSPWHQGAYTSPVGGQCTYALSMPGDQPVLGTTSFNKVHAPGNGPGDDATLQCEQAAYWLVKERGLHANHQRYVLMYVNGGRRGSLMEDTQVPAGDVLEERYPGDADGPLYKLNGWYEYAPGTGQVLQHTLWSWCTLNLYTSGDEKKLARYRWNWSPRSEGETANDYTDVFNLIDAANTPRGGPYVANLRGQADTEQWLRTFAMEHTVGNWDSFGNRNAQNMYAYKPSAGLWQLLIWDFNIVLGNSGSDGPTGDNLLQYNGADRGMNRIYQEPEFLRVYFREMLDIANGPMSDPRFAARLDAKYAAIKANGLSASTPTSIKTWVTSRRKYLQNTLNQFNTQLALDAAWSDEFQTNRNFIELTGSAPLGVASLRANGTPYPVRWTSLTNWSMLVPLHSGLNAIVVEGFDAAGRPIAGTSVTAKVNYSGTEPDLAQSLVINELLFRPMKPGAEFIELVNRSTNSVIDMTNLRLQGVDFAFAPGTVMLPGAYGLLVKNRAAFGSVYGYNQPVMGEFPGQLSASGETLRLVRDLGSSATVTVVDEVTYSTRPPWPAGAAGTGVSLQLSEPGADNSVAESWSAVTAEEAAHPEWKYVSVTGTAGDSKLLLYHSPYEAERDPMELEGSWAGTIEFPGQQYQMTVEFHRESSNRWSGMFLGEDLTNPLGSIRFTPPSVSFSLADVPVSILWSGKMSTNGNKIDGTFSQSTPQGSMSAPFHLTRVVDPARPSGGDMYIDDLQLVAGAAAGVGQNLIQDGDFEAPLDGLWQISSNHAGTTISTAAKHSGNSSLRLLAKLGGKDAETAVWQVTLPLVAGQTYTLSYWYLPTTNGNELTAELPGGSLRISHSIRPDSISTPGLPNSQGSTVAPPVLPAVYINEWMANNTQTLADPADGQFEDWFELFNAESHEVDLSGYTLTDSAAAKDKWHIPAGTVIPARGFLLVWADEDTGQNGPGNGLHANFKLSQGGESIGLFSPNGALIDWVDFGAQIADMSEGRSSDGGSGSFTRFTACSPGTSNSPAGPQPVQLIGCRVDPDKSVTLSWATDTGRRYYVEYKASLTDSAWTPLGQPVIGDGTPVSFRDESASQSVGRFYRLRKEDAQ